MALTTWFLANGSPLAVLAAEVLWMLAPAIAVVAAIAILAFLIVQTYRYCQEFGCPLVQMVAESVVKWSFKAGEIAQVKVEAVSDAVAPKGCQTVGDPSFVGPIVEPDPEECGCPEGEKGGGSGAGVELDLVYRPHWSQSQRDAADRKIEYLQSLAESKQLKVLGTKVDRNPYKTRCFRDQQKACGIDTTGMDVDHKQDLQLSGEDTYDNMWLLDSEVNQDLGRQIRQQIRCLPPGTPVTIVTIHD